MRRRGISGSAAILLGVCMVILLATPADAQVIWWNEPPLAYDRPLTFIDTVAPSVGSLRLARWRGVRDAALGSWGVPYILAEDWSGTLPPCDGTGEQVGITGVIRICRDVSGAMISTGGWLEGPQGGIVVIPLPRGWFKPWDPWNIQGAIAHEIGHAFGLGHSLTGVMGGATRPNAEERLAVQIYYA